ncbi:MAG: beta-ketoacyl synthase chain length factor [Gemmatimonas sp.]
MSSPLSFRVVGWAAWTPGRDSEAAWRTWAGAPGVAAGGTATASVPLALRRRLTPLGQAAMRCAWGLPDAASARMVFASRNGEFARTLSILDGIVSGDSVSPADFTLSVHHALAGVLSIAQGNRRGHTTVAAGPDSFGFGLLEAVASLAERPEEPVLLVYYDEPLPAPYATFATCAEPLALALSLSLKRDGEALELLTARGSGDATMIAPFDFLRFLLSGDAQMLSRGERLDWHWRRHAAAA